MTYEEYHEFQRYPLPEIGGVDFEEVLSEIELNLAYEELEEIKRDLNVPKNKERGLLIGY